MLETISKDTSTLVTELMPMFKEHLRILATDEDELIKIYLGASIGAINRYVDQDIFKTDYAWKYIDYEDEIEIIHNRYGRGLYVEKENIYDVIIKDRNNVDVSADYKVDKQRGYIYPSPIFHDEFTFSSGYASKDDMDDHLKIIVFRYGATLYEMRESIMVGEPKQMPDWVNYALATYRKQKV